MGQITRSDGVELGDKRKARNVFEKRLIFLDLRSLTVQAPVTSADREYIHIRLYTKR